MKDRWSTVASVQSDNLDALVHQSRLIGDETKLVLRGGGNTSIKRDEVDFRGRGVRVLRIKGSGSDLRTIKRGDFPGVRLDDVLPLIERDDMADEDMVAYLGNCLMEPGSRRPSIETLLHAFVPAVSVAHTHADAILSLTNTVDHLALLSDLYDDRVILIPYRRPGFLLSKEVGMAVRENPTARGVDSAESRSGDLGRIGRGQLPRPYQARYRSRGLRIESKRRQASLCGKATISPRPRIETDGGRTNSTNNPGGPLAEMNA